MFLCARARLALSVSQHFFKLSLLFFMLLTWRLYAHTHSTNIQNLCEFRLNVYVNGFHSKKSTCRNVQSVCNSICECFCSVLSIRWCRPVNNLLFAHFSAMFLVDCYRYSNCFMVCLRCTTFILTRLFSLFHFFLSTWWTPLKSKILESGYLFFFRRLDPSIHPSSFETCNFVVDFHCSHRNECKVFVEHVHTWRVPTVYGVNVTLKVTILWPRNQQRRHQKIIKFVQCLCRWLTTDENAQSGVVISEMKLWTDDFGPFARVAVWNIYGNKK